MAQSDLPKPLLLTASIFFSTAALAIYRLDYFNIAPQPRQANIAMA
jgi:hypothetical protein